MVSVFRYSLLPTAGRSLFCQSVIHLKTGDIKRIRTATVAEISSPAPGVPGHLCCSSASTLPRHRPGTNGGRWNPVLGSAG